MPGIVGSGVPKCRERDEISKFESHCVSFGWDGTEWNGIRYYCEDMYERSYVFRLCATKNLNSKKTVEKGKISVFSFGMELLLWGISKVN